MSSTPKIAVYKVLQYRHLGELVKAVNEDIKKGWQPVGQVVSDTTATSTMIHSMYLQTMVLYEI